MKNIIAITLLLSSSSIFAEDSPYGIWKFPTTLVFIEIKDNGVVFQCRIDKNQSVITANGKYDGQKTIDWEPIKAVDANGNPLEMDYSWKQDEVTVVKNTIALSGPYGTFSFETTNSKFPEKCR
jgi:hypothetical protein